MMDERRPVDRRRGARSRSQCLSVYIYMCVCVCAYERVCGEDYLMFCTPFARLRAEWTVVSVSGFQHPLRFAGVCE